MNANDNPLQNELCFQLYVASKESIRMYKPFLDEVDLTYTGFITLMAIEDNLSVKQLGERLFLDSGTLSPLLKKDGKTRTIASHTSQHRRTAIGYSADRERKITARKTSVHFT